MLVVANLLESREGPRHSQPARRRRDGRKPRHQRVSHPAHHVRDRRAAWPAISGWLYAHMSRFVSPAPFDVRMGIEYLFMAILGGSGQILGAVVGLGRADAVGQCAAGHPAAFLAAMASNLQAIVFAVIYVLALQFARGGVMPFVLRFLPGRSKPPLAALRSLCRDGTMPEAGTPLSGGRPPDQAIRRP